MNTKKNTKSASPVYKKWWFWAVIVVVVMGIAGIAGNGEPDQGTTQPTETTATEETTTAPTEANEYAVVEKFVELYNASSEIPISNLVAMDIQGEDYRYMQTPIDFYGLNIYNRVVVSGKSDLHKKVRYLGRRPLPIIYHLGFTESRETEGKMNSALFNQKEDGSVQPWGPYQQYLESVAPGNLEKLHADYIDRMRNKPVYYAAPSVLRNSP